MYLSFFKSSMLGCGLSRKLSCIGPRCALRNFQSGIYQYRTNGNIFDEQPKENLFCYRNVSVSGNIHNMTSNRLYSTRRGNGDRGECSGKITQVMGSIVDVQFEHATRVPPIMKTLSVNTPRGELILEVSKHIGDRSVRAVAMGITDGITRGDPVNDLGIPITIPVGNPTLGRIMNAIGSALDSRGPINSDISLPIHRKPPEISDQIEQSEIIVTGIKIIDLFAPFVRGGKNGLFGGSCVGKTSTMMEIINNIAKHDDSICVFAGIGTRIREANELYFDLINRGTIDINNPEKSKVSLVLGQMDESPGLRHRVALSALTVAEYFRDTGKDVLLLIDNIYRFSQAGIEVATMLEQIPFQVSCQPALGNEIGDLQERITSTKNGNITAIQAIYTPYDDLEHPAASTTFSHLDSAVVFCSKLAERGIYPAIDPVESLSRMIDPEIVGDRHCEVSMAAKQLIQEYNGLKDVINILGLDDFSDEDLLKVERAKKLLKFLTQPLHVSEANTGVMGQYVSLDETLDGVEAILDGDADHLPEDAFYMVGTFDEVENKAAQLDPMQATASYSLEPDNEFLRDFEIRKPIYYLKEVIKRSEEIATTTIEQMKKRGSKEELIQDYEEKLRLWRQQLPQLMKEEESFLPSENEETNDTWEFALPKFLESSEEKFCCHISAETKELAAKLPFDIFPPPIRQ